MLLFYTSWKHQKTQRFSYVFRGYRKETLGCNGSCQPLKNLLTVFHKNKHINFGGNVKTGKIVWKWRVEQKFCQGIGECKPTSRGTKIFPQGPFCCQPIWKYQCCVFLDIYYLLMYRGIIKKLRKAIKPLNVKIL